jgi:hypothetical protein
MIHCEPSTYTMVFVIALGGFAVIETVRLRKRRDAI